MVNQHYRTVRSFNRGPTMSMQGSAKHDDGMFWMHPQAKERLHQQHYYQQYDHYSHTHQQQQQQQQRQQQIGGDQRTESSPRWREHEDRGMYYRYSHHYDQRNHHHHHQQQHHHHYQHHHPHQQQLEPAPKRQRIERQEAGRGLPPHPTSSVVAGATAAVSSFASADHHRLHHLAHQNQRGSTNLDSLLPPPPDIQRLALPSLLHPSRPVGATRSYRRRNNNCVMDHGQSNDNPTICTSLDFLPPPSSTRSRVPSQK